MKKQIIITLKYFLIITVLTGIVYPLFISTISVLAFQDKASGSLIEKDGKVIGSKLIGQKFESEKYFWSRPSAVDYNPMPSGGSNYGPTSAALKKFYDDKEKYFNKKNSIKDASSVPNEMFFASASGVDPHISPASALLQVERIVKARNFNKTKKEIIAGLIDSLTEKPQFGFMGNEVVNVLLLNIALDKIN
jgi:potassium-transporting ATPase KdpC subunit